MVKAKSYYLGFMMLCLPWGAGAQTLNVSSSGIDWSASQLTVLNFSAAHSSHEENFNCFGATYLDLPASYSLAEIGFENPDSGPLTLTQTLKESVCFQQAGVYNIEVELHDRAGNQASFETELTVVPTDLDLSTTSILPIASQTSGGKNSIADITNRLNCTSRTLVADGQDECILELRLQDRFQNVITPDGVSGALEVSLPTDNAAENLDATQNLYGGFLAGLYFADDEKKARFTLPQETDRLKLGLKAYLPSLEADDSNQKLLAQPQVVNLGLKFTDEEGKSDAGQQQKIIKPLFSPWVHVVAKPKDSLENFLLLPLNRPVAVPLQLANWAQKALPPKLSLDWETPDTERLWVRFWSTPGQRLEVVKQLVTVKQSPQLHDLGIELVQPEGAMGSESFTLKPVVTYPQLINGQQQLVRYPLDLLSGKGAEHLASFGPLELAASIEGRTLADGNQSRENGAVLSDVDKLQFTSWREKVTRAAFDLIRGQSPRFDDTFNLHQGFGDRDVVYFKDTTVRLTSDDDVNDAMTFDGGVKTIIIEDGNLLITRDLLYKTNKDSLGIILINTESNDVNHGHVFVHQNVQRVAGSYFLDGVIASTQNLLEPSITDIIADRETTNNQDVDAPLALQLLLEGTVFSRNTLGGADQNPSIGANGKTLQRELALIYDLNYLRRYEPGFDDKGERVEDADNNYCVKPEGKACYPNSAPMVIRYDARVKEFPPPGFK